MAHRTLNTIEAVAEASRIGTCLRLDTLVKIAPKFWPAWGICLDPSDPAVRKASVDGYKVEWLDAGPEANATVAEGAKRAGMGDANKLMNEAMAKMVAGCFTPKQPLVVIDLGCGPGGSSLALHTRVGSGRRRLSILVDPSSKALEKAASEMRSAGWSVSTHKMLTEDWLTRDEGPVELKHTNVVLMGASLHHMDVDFVLGALRKHLRSGALIAVADWCHPMLRSPGHFRVLAETLDRMVEPGILARFDENFPTTEEERAAVMQETRLDKAALLSMAGPGGFWVCHALECREKGIKPMFSPYEGHRPVGVWLDEFRQNGFGDIYTESVTPNNSLHTVFLLEQP